MKILTLLRRLAEQHDYSGLREACLGADPDQPDVQVLLAIADVHLGDASAGRRALASLDRDALGFETSIDVAAVHMALGELDEAIHTLETARRAISPIAPKAAAEEGAAHALLLARLAWCRLQQGRRDDALALYEQSLALRPYLAVYRNLLRLYRNSGRLADMAACLEAAQRFWAREQACWPADQRRMHGRQLRGAQLDLWLANECFEETDAWVERQRDALSAGEWCELLSDLAERLAAHDRHAQAEEWLRTGLRHYPDHLPLYERLAELAQLQGRPLQAIALLRRAIRLASARRRPSTRLWTRLSATALQTHPRLAREAAEQARNHLLWERSPDRASNRSDQDDDPTCHVELALAGVEAQEQDFAAAEQRYRHLLDARPHLVPALRGMGQLCLQLGRLDEAVALFERIKAIDPAQGYGALIQARGGPEDDETLERLERFARTPGMEGSVRAGLLFQLAAAWEKRDDYDRAFALADEANTASRRLLRYDPKVHRQRCARIRHAFPRALFERRADCGHPSALPVFVVGMPRSGTTLVEQIIAGHSRIHGAGELGVIPRVIAGLERWERHTGSGRCYPDCVDDIDPTVARGIAGNVLKELREYAPDADHVVDKLPHNFENLGLIRLLFPRAKIISVRRDPRDIAISNFFIDYAGKHGGMGFAYHLDWIGEQLADHNLLMHHWKQVWPEGILEIRYEDVVDDPARSARRLLDHIGVHWEPQVLEFTALERPVRTASVWQVRQPLYTSSKARWRRYRQHLAPLIAATNRSICPDAIDMVTLPEPGWLNSGVDHYRQDDLDAAEDRFQRLLHHLPSHGAARFMLGLIYVRKGHLGDGITLMEGAVQRCPWNHHWRSDLAQAYRLDGRPEDAARLADATGPADAGDPRAPRPTEADVAGEPAARLDYLFLSGESTCSTFGTASSSARC